MKILKQLERTTIIADDNRTIRCMFQNRIYEIPSFKCVSDPGQKPLYPHLREEVLDNYEEAKRIFEQTGTETTTTASSGVGSELERLLMETIAQASVSRIFESVKPKLDEYIMKTYGMIPQIHEVVTPTDHHKIEGVVHEKFDQVLNLVSMNIPVFLTGAAGTGKNVICKQVAEGLGLDFYFTNAVTQEYQLKGFIDANGTFHETQFYKAFTNGGLFFLDEMDGSIPETLIILNAAIANGYFDFPTGKVEANPNFRVIAAGNTVGTGADIEYTGRFQLDAASLDRFALVEINYSINIEKAVTNGNKDLCEFAHTFRDVAIKSGIRCLFSYRSMERITKLESVMDDLSEILKISLIKGLGKDDISILANEIRNEGNNSKYTKALHRLAA